MSTQPKTAYQFEALLQQRAESSERTRLKLHQALDRFEHDQLLILPPGSKLTIRNLALEADVSKDTPLSRYRKDQPNGGDYRFPDIVARFNKLKTRKPTRPSSNNLKEVKIQELRQIIESLQEKNLLLARANNQLDIRAIELERRCRELEEQNARLRQECLKIVPFVRS
jgi:exonuclease VII small subunit